MKLKTEQAVRSTKAQNNLDVKTSPVWCQGHGGCWVRLFGSKTATLVASVYPQILLVHALINMQFPFLKGVAAAAAAAAKSLQSCPTLGDPRDSSHKAPPSLGFFRQEYWSGLPLPSPLKGATKSHFKP